MGATSAAWREVFRRDFPREHLEASRSDEELQERNRRLVEDARAANADLVCLDCGSGVQLAWFWFSSPQWTWENLCGRAGVVAWCDRHERQVAFDMRVMN